MKKTLCLLVVTVISCAGFLFAACDALSNSGPDYGSYDYEMSLYEKFGVGRLYASYEYDGASVEAWYPEHDMWQVDVTERSIQQFSYPEVIRYSGDNKFVLKMQELLEPLGRRIAVSEDSLVFDGALGRMSAKITPDSYKFAYLEIFPTPEQSNLIKFKCDRLLLTHHISAVKTDYASWHFLSLDLRFEDVEIEGETYHFNVEYRTLCGCAFAD